MKKNTIESMTYFNNLKLIGHMQLYDNLIFTTTIIFLLTINSCLTYTINSIYHKELLYQQKY